MNLSRFSSRFMAAALTASTLLAADTAPATKAINEFGLELHQRLAAKAPGDNLCLSPFSIEAALAMTYAGADGDTQKEMAKVLHLGDGEKIHDAFATLEKSLAAAAEKSVAVVKDSKKNGGPMEPLTLSVANRLYGQQGYDFRKPFLGLLEKTYRAPFETVDFTSKPQQIRNAINGWVEKETHERIRDLIPADGITELTRLVLVDAIYLKAPWATEFSDKLTGPELFHPASAKAHKVPTMQRVGTMGYAKGDGYQAVTLPYVGDELQFLILLPDKSLPALEKSLSAATLAKHANLPQAEVELYLPKFKIAAPTIALKDELKRMGMTTAFDEPAGSANFDRMSPRTDKGYLFIGQVYHKTFIGLDERGTEAAAAAAVVMMYRGLPQPAPKPIEVRVNRPFLFAVQHKASGACLFLGRVADPQQG